MTSPQRRSFSSSKTPPPSSPDYQSLAMDRVVWNEHVSVDAAEAEANLQRLAKESENNPSAPNLLLNMLEMMHHEDAQVISTKTRQEIFRRVVKSKNVKLLQRAEDLIVWKNRQDPNLLRLLIVGYVHAGAAEKACELLLRWNKFESPTPYPMPSIKSYRLVLTALAKKGDHRQALELLHHLCRGQQRQEELDQLSLLDDNNLLPAPDRDCFQRVLLACEKSKDNDTAFATAQKAMQLMTLQSSKKEVGVTRDDADHSSPLNNAAVLPTRSSIRLFLKVWQRSQNPEERQMLKEKAFDWLRDMERNAQHEIDLANGNTATAPNSIPDVQCYNLVLDALAQDGFYQQAEGYLQQMLSDYLKQKSVVQPDDVSLHTVLKAHVRAGSVEAAEAAEKFLERVETFAIQQRQLLDSKKTESNDYKDTSKGEDKAKDLPLSQQPIRMAELRPKARAYATVISFWLKLGNPDRAVAVLKKAEALHQRELQHGWNHSNQFRPDIVCYRSIVSALSNMQPLTTATAHMAQNIAQQMSQTHRTPDLLLCNTILSMWVKVGKPQEAEKFLETFMEQDHSVFDIISYNTVVQGYCNVPNGLDRAIQILERLLHTKPAVDSAMPALPNPNTRTFTSILTALSREKTKDAATQAEEMILEMQDLYETKNMDTRPNVFSFNAVLNCWASLSCADRKNSRQHGQRAIEILEGMKATKEGSPTVVSYNTCIKAQRNDSKKAEKLLKDMLANGIYPNDNTWKSLMFVVKHDNRFKDKSQRADNLRNEFFAHLDSGRRNGSEMRGRPTMKNRAINSKQ